MARQRTRKGEPAKQVAIDVLREAGGPLHAKEVAKRVLESGRSSGLKGKTPEATISAMLAVGSKPGGPFKRVDKGTYVLADATTPPDEDAPADKPEAKPRSRKRQKETPAA
jgi:HB1, ASXL, restriction endonuclease HTH domain